MQVTEGRGKMTIAVAGATGLIGRHVVDALAGRAGEPVVATYRSRAPFSAEGVRWVQCDFTDRDQASRTFAGCDTVILCAGRVSTSAVLRDEPVESVLDNLRIVTNAMEAAARPHHFLGINHEGHAAIVTTTGNPDGHLVLRGGKRGTNFHAEAVQEAAAALAKDGLQPRLMVDCSHGNSNKDYRRQSEVAAQVGEQLIAGSSPIMGVMIESHLVAGNQKIPSDLSQLTYGQSITDACIDLASTRVVLAGLAKAVALAQRGLVRA